jgi:hypothetical protein
MEKVKNTLEKRKETLNKLLDTQPKMVDEYTAQISAEIIEEINQIDKSLLILFGVGSSNKVDYKQGFELAQKYIEESPCDPDIYRTQLDAWNDYQQFLIDNNIT